MRLSVPAARNGALVINIVLTAARRASVWVVFIFIMLFFRLLRCWFLTLATHYAVRRPCAIRCNQKVSFGELPGENRFNLNLGSQNPSVNEDFSMASFPARRVETADAMAAG